MKFTGRPLICILDKHEGEKIENTSPIVFVTFIWSTVTELMCGFLTDSVVIELLIFH